MSLRTIINVHGKMIQYCLQYKAQLHEQKERVCCQTENRVVTSDQAKYQHKSHNDYTKNFRDKFIRN